MKLKLHWMTALLLFLGFGLTNTWSQVTTFSYTGGMQTYVVPLGVTSLEMDLFGAAGYGDLGQGGRCKAELAVTPGETLNIYVGGAGTSTGGGFNGGGTPGTNATYGGGGGASDIRQGGTGLANRIIVAGGGGGSGSNCGTWTAEGGHGGGLIAESGCLYSCSSCQYTGGGGSQVAGGIAGPTTHTYCDGNTDGVLGIGGSNTVLGYGTGGGGGYYGGGSGCFEGAGGGSSYTHPDAEAVVHEQGAQLGDGEIIITVLCTPLSLTPIDSEFCFGEELVLDATSEFGGSISWDGGVTDGVGFEPPVGISTYTATSDADGDCGFSVEIEVYALPEVTASASEEEVCLGEMVTFTGGGATTYEWTPVDITDGSPYEVEETGTFTVIGTDDNGCENTAEVEVTVNELPEVVATADDDEVCDGDEVTLTGEGATDYDWDMGVTDGEAFAQEVGTETYTVTGTDDNGCENTAEIDITVNELPTVTASASETEVCFGYEVTFTGGGATDYDWDMGVTDSEPAIMDTEGTVTFTVVGTDDNGCENTASVDVEVADEIVVTFVTSDEIMGSDGGIEISVSGGVAPYTYDWDNDGTGDFDDTEDLTDLPAGVYTVTVQDSDGCTTTVEITVDSQVGINELNEVSLNVYPNPTTGFVTVEFEGTFNYELTDINGAVIAQATATDKEIISLENVARGVYFVMIKSNDTVHTAKVVKK